MNFEEKFRSRRLAACFSAAVVVALTSGCASAVSALETEEVSERRIRVIGPLEQYLVRIHGTKAQASMQSGSEVQAWIDRIHLEAEEHIAACMRAQGFDYVINPSSSRYAIDPWEIEFSVPYGTRAWAETYGFGVSHPELTPEPPAWDAPHHAAELLAQMTDSEAESWFYALYGANSADQLQGGCFRAAQLAVDPAWQQTEVTGFEPISDEVDRFMWLSSPWNSDSPFFSEMDVDWQNCMAQTGLDMRGSRNPRQLHQEMRNEHSNVISRIMWGAANDDDETARLNREIEYAVANWDCVHDTDYDARLLAAQLAAEQEFVNKHGDLLEEWAVSNEMARAHAASSSE